TDGICQGQQVQLLWPHIFATGNKISFAHTSFWWGNLASNEAVVLVAIIGISPMPVFPRRLFSSDGANGSTVRIADNINGYLIAGPDVCVEARSSPSDDRAVMQFGNHPYYGTALIRRPDEGRRLMTRYPSTNRFMRPLYGSQELINGVPR